jgi:5-formyltetrahydrofolate cyclo-ligase
MDGALAAWRRGTRTELLSRRRAVPLIARQRAAQVVGEKLRRICAERRPATVGIYWPIKDEINLLVWARTQAEAGGLRLCLPVVVQPREPLEYWVWVPGERMNKGVWDIPQPRQREPATPDLVLAPLVGFDRAGYRLGYGGGYFDRTLKAMTPSPFAVGVGYAFGALETIHPQPHDVRMDRIVTEQEDDVA